MTARDVSRAARFELSRRPWNRRKVSRSTGAARGRGRRGEVVLSPYDNVLILPQPDWRLLRTVVITGEVRSPGRYTIENKSERVSDLVKRAGGLSVTANADGAYYSRRRASVSYESRQDSVRAKSDTSARVGIDLQDVLHDARSVDNLLLEDGDSLDIPPVRATVEVKGAVNLPTVVAIAPGEKLEHYVRAAGRAEQEDGRCGRGVRDSAKREDREPAPGGGAVAVGPYAAGGGDGDCAGAGYAGGTGAGVADVLNDYDIAGDVVGGGGGDSEVGRKLLHANPARREHIASVVLQACEPTPWGHDDLVGRE